MATINSRKRFDTVEMLEVDSDPASGSGAAAPVGSIAILAGGVGFWQKFGTGDTDWITAQALDPAKGFYIFDDFLASDSGSDVSDAAWNFSGLMSTSSEANHPGIFSLSVASSASNSSIDLQTNSITLATGTYVASRTLVRVPTLSTGTQEFFFRWGLQDTTTGSGLPSDGVLFTYNRTVSTNWYCSTVNGGTNTTSTGVAVSAGSWVKLEYRVTGTSSVVFLINDVVVATHTTNIPTTSVGPVFRLYKSVGSITRTVDLDYCDLRMIFSR